MTNLINCGTCGYPLTPEERTTLIVDQTEELTVWLLSWTFNRQPETGNPMRDTRPQTLKA